MDGEQQQVVVPVVFGIPLSYSGLLRMPSLADCESGLPRRDKWEMQGELKMDMRDRISSICLECKLGISVVVPLALNEHDVVVVDGVSDGVSDASSKLRPTASSLIDWHVSIAWRRDAWDL
ncbi:hypothetical protein M0804_004412 [Polistes exclamans]|nr:hypothetical protein M0804_004412 [Polistes exclamans]